MKIEFQGTPAGEQEKGRRRSALSGRRRPLFVPRHSGLRGPGGKFLAGHWGTIGVASGCLRLRLEWQLARISLLANGIRPCHLLTGGIWV